MMKRLILLVCIGFLAFNLSAQQRPVNSLYMFDQLIINPAYAGTHVQLSATAMYRNQWVNFPGAPKTFTGTIHSGFVRNKVGIGLMLIQDVIGVHEDTYVYMSYSYKLQMPVGNLSFGLQGGFNYIESDYTKTNPKDPGTAFFFRTTAFNPNFGAGLFYSNREFYVGFSVPYLLNSELLSDFEGTLSEARRTRNYFITAGNTYDLSPDLKVIPSTLLRFQEGAPVSFDISSNFILKESVGLGATYRLTEGFIYMFELKINENFHVGYAYDMTMSALRSFSSGSHEFMLNYRIKIPRLHKGLECPSYF
ncbi:MAG: PorP/SprF family type IX secretion system membrane protein [Candidatus Cyclobacteriaceae bacterium M2_1C_046]